MPFLTDKEIQQRLEHPDNLKNRLQVHKIEKGRGNNPEVPIEIKKTIAILSNEGESQTSLAKSFDLSPSSVFQYENGGSSYGKIPELQKVVKEVKTKIKEQKEQAEQAAIDTLLVSIGMLTPEKLGSVSKAKDISSIAKDMATVAEKLSDRGRSSEASQLHVHLHAPPVKQLSDFEVIDV